MPANVRGSLGSCISVGLPKTISVIHLSFMAKCKHLRYFKEKSPGAFWEKYVNPSNFTQSAPSPTPMSSAITVRGPLSFWAERFLESSGMAQKLLLFTVHLYIFLLKKDRASKGQPKNRWDHVHIEGTHWLSLQMSIKYPIAVRKNIWYRRRRFNRNRNK